MYIYLFIATSNGKCSSAQIATVQKPFFQLNPMIRSLVFEKKKKNLVKKYLRNILVRLG
jgi:hypothetical protein